MTLTVDYGDFGKLAALMNALGPGGRARLNRVGAKALEVALKGHLRRIAPGRHATAASLGANPTGHLRRGMAGIRSSATAAGGEVVVPIPGISRAWDDIRMTTPTREGKRYYTIPKHAASYGHTVAWMRAKGWKIFRPGKKLCLLGYERRGDKPVLLYALAEAVHQRKDPSLMPGRAECSAIVARAMAAEVNKVIAKARAR